MRKSPVMGGLVHIFPTMTPDRKMPEIMDDWYWFLMCYWMILFQPLRYAKLARQNKENKRKK